MTSDHFRHRVGKDSICLIMTRKEAKILLRVLEDYDSVDISPMMRKRVGELANSLRRGIASTRERI